MRALVYAVLGFIVLRFIIFIVVIYTDIELGYFIDLSILTYLIVWLLCVRNKKFSLPYLLWINFVVAVVSTLIFNILVALWLFSTYVQIFKSPDLLNAVFIEKANTLLEIIGLSIVACIGYYFIQSMSNKNDDEENINLEIESPK